MGTPQDRVREFVEEHERWEGEDSHIATTGVYSSPIRVSLYSNDLKETLEELDEAMNVLIEIDKALDPRWAGELVTEAEALAEIRRIMGRPHD